MTMTVTQPNQGETENGARDFDFWMGRWRIKNKRLVKRLAGCTEWETFEAIGRAWQLPGGIGNYDEFIPVDWRPGFVGMTLRVFNRQTRCWSIYWLDNAGNGLDPATGLLLPPVVGGFKDGIGVFVGPDSFEGRPITVKFVWSAITRTSARWHQEFSADQGRTWETNWINEMTKLEE